jgi:hypothetical protein
MGALERAPALVIPLVRQAHPAIVKRRPSPGEWSIHENACHLAEVHPLFFRHLPLHDFHHAYCIEELLLRRDWPVPSPLEEDS